MHAWADDAVFYHIYPLGFTGAPARNDHTSAPVPRLEKVASWLDHLEDLGVTAIYLGPVFESDSHGYDTMDYYSVDRRLGTNDTLARVSDAVHARGMRLVLDGVFNHVGRSFAPFLDVRRDPTGSPYRSWFSGIDCSKRSPLGDGFSYDCWEGHAELPELNLSDPGVRDHLSGAVGMWMDRFGIDGLRLDVAYCLDRDFLSCLGSFCRRKRSDFWLMGEMIHGDYRSLIDGAGLDSVTNYECSKGLWSSHRDGNYFEIAWSFDRQFGEQGLYRGLSLYSFVDNHDVDRVASSVSDPAHLYPLYGLLFTMPGIPSVYYGSEWGIPGRRTPRDDGPLRPCLELEHGKTASNRDLAPAIRRFARLRKSQPALRYGAYRKLHVGSRQFAFMRSRHDEALVVAVNSDTKPAALEVDTGLPDGTVFHDLLEGGGVFEVSGGRLRLPVLHPCWIRILRASEARIPAGSS